MAGADGPQPSPRRGHGPWPWIAAALAVACVGLLVWGTAKSDDLEESQADVATLQRQAEQEKTEEDGITAAVRSFAGQVADRVGAASTDLDATEEALRDAEQAAQEAEQEAEQAVDRAEEVAGDAKGRLEEAGDAARAEVEALRARADAAERKVAVSRECARGFASALGTLFEGESVRAQAATVRRELEAIAEQCRATLGSS